jgi:hypothetical protein
MRNKKITFAGAGGSQLSARLSLPPDGKVVACALFAHCFTCSKDLKPVVNISRALTQQRIAVLRFDFTGLGESEGDFADTTFSSNIEDLVAAAAGSERGFQDVRLAHVAAARFVVAGRSDREAAAAPSIQDGDEHGGTVEAWEAEPLERSSARDERRRPAVADDGVIADRRIDGAHRARTTRVTPAASTAAS